MCQVLEFQKVENDEPVREDTTRSNKNLNFNQQGDRIKKVRLIHETVALIHVDLRQHDDLRLGEYRWTLKTLTQMGLGVIVDAVLPVYVLKQERQK